MSPSGIDLSRAEWRKSSQSGGNGGQCVEVAQNLPAVVAVRDSKDRCGDTLVFSRATWAAFLDSVRHQAATPCP
jgi:hypothetical protein